MTPLLGTPGCGLELAALGAAASAASQGAAAFKRGKLVASWMGPFDVVVASGEAAFGDLGYRIVETTGDAEAGHWKIVAKDEQNDKITIFVNRQTSRLTEFEIDVTWFGRETTARLILKRMATAINLNADQDGTGDILPAAPAEILNGPKPEE
ncbi:MAG: DUF3568 family protein [Planctomycetota bacterium]